MLHEAIVVGAPTLSFSGRDAPRHQRLEPPREQRRDAKGGRFRAGKLLQFGPVDEPGRHSLVSSARAFVGLHGVRIVRGPLERRVRLRRATIGQTYSSRTNRGDNGFCSLSSNTVHNLQKKVFVLSFFEL